MVHYTLTVISFCPNCGTDTEFLYLTTGNSRRIYYCTKCCSVPDDHHMDKKTMKEIVAKELKRVLLKIEPVKESYSYIESHD